MPIHEIVTTLIAIGIMVAGYFAKSAIDDTKAVAKSASEKSNELNTKIAVLENEVTSLVSRVTSLETSTKNLEHVLTELANDVKHILLWVEKQK